MVNWKLKGIARRLLTVIKVSRGYTAMINMADIFLMTIGKEVRGYMRRTKGRGMMAGDFFAHLKKVDKIRHDFLMMANTMI